VHPRSLAALLLLLVAHRHHFFAPYHGHPSATDFVRFREDSFVRFEDELPDLYVAPPSP
jgi:hypothetical protein